MISKSFPFTLIFGFEPVFVVDGNKKFEKDSIFLMEQVKPSLKKYKTIEISIDDSWLKETLKINSKDVQDNFKWLISSKKKFLLLKTEKIEKKNSKKLFLMKKEGSSEIKILDFYTPQIMKPNSFLLKTDVFLRDFDNPSTGKFYFEFSNQIDLKESKLDEFFKILDEKKDENFQKIEMKSKWDEDLNKLLVKLIGIQKDIYYSFEVNPGAIKDIYGNECVLPFNKKSKVERRFVEVVPPKFAITEKDSKLYNYPNFSNFSSVMELKRNISPKTAKDISEIIPKKLYLTGYFYTASELKQLNIKTIANFSSESSLSKVLPVLLQQEPEVDKQNDSDENYYSLKKIKCRDFPIEDFPKQSLLQLFPIFYDFVENCEAPILVHCTQGVSRSAAMVASYLMKSKKMKMIETLEFIKKIRPIINPNYGFREDLLIYEEKINQESLKN